MTRRSRLRPKLPRDLRYAVQYEIGIAPKKLEDLETSEYLRQVLQTLRDQNTDLQLGDVVRLSYFRMNHPLAIVLFNGTTLIPSPRVWSRKVQIHPSKFQHVFQRAVPTELLLLPIFPRDYWCQTLTHEHLRVDEFSRNLPFFDHRPFLDQLTQNFIGEHLQSSFQYRIEDATELEKYLPKVLVTLVSSYLLAIYTLEFSRCNSHYENTTVLWGIISENSFSREVLFSGEWIAALVGY